MKKCRFFWDHDYELVYEKQKLKENLYEHLEDMGYTLHSRNRSFDFWKQENSVTIAEYAFGEDCLDGCIPNDVYSKVCLNCGKVVSSYDVKDCVSKLDNLIKKKRNEFKRGTLAKELRNKSNE